MSQTEEGRFHNDYAFLMALRIFKSSPFVLTPPLPAGIMTWSKRTSRRSVRTNLELLWITFPNTSQTKQV